MLVVILLQTVEIARCVLAGVDVMQRIMRDVVGHVANQEASPKEGRNDGIFEVDNFEKSLLPDEEGEDCQNGRVDQSIAA